MRPVFVILLVLLAVPATAAAFTIDGDLSDWGVSPGPYGASDWTPVPGVFFNEEDQIADFLGPGYGGQIYDAEAIYAYADPTSLYVAVVTGFPPSGHGGYVPGDLRISFPDASTTDTFALRTTGGGLVPGNVYLTAPGNWATGLFAAGGVTRITGHQGLAGTAEYFYGPQAGFAANGSHYVIEAAIPVAQFGAYWGGTYQLHWTMTCGNDAIDLTGVASVIPEPAPVLLLALGLLGLWFRARRVRAA